MLSNVLNLFRPPYSPTIGKILKYPIKRSRNQSWDK